MSHKESLCKDDNICLPFSLPHLPDNIYGLTWSSGDLRLRSAKASPSCLCVCIIWDSWLASVWASLITCWYFLLLSRRTSIWASSSMSTVLEPRPSFSDRICLVHCRGQQALMLICMLMSIFSYLKSFKWLLEVSTGFSEEKLEMI